MNWKKTVQRLNAEHYAFPAGWDDRETIAAQLECSPDRVDTLLAPGLKSGEIEKAQHPVWDPRLQRKVLVWGYRHRPAPANTTDKPTRPPATPADTTDELTAAILRHHRRHPHLPHHRLVAYLPPRLRGGVTVAQVAAVLKNH